MSNNIVDKNVSDKVVWENGVTHDNDFTPTISQPQPEFHSQSQKMFCYNCNNVIPSNSTFCPYCQIKLFAECPKCGTKYSSQYPACNQCGTNREEYLRVQKIEQVPHSPKKEINGHEYIDLGLPSGLKWATCNVGANKPEEYGDFFAWGEDNAKYEYTRKNCKTIKSRLLGAIIEENGVFIDTPKSRWGSSWRMPSRTEMLELICKCTWIWTSKNGVKGMNVTGPNGNSIFLPAAGYYEGKLHKNLDVNGEFFGAYWSSTSNASLGQAYLLAFGLDFDIKNKIRYNIIGARYFYGKTIRPVSQ